MITNFKVMFSTLSSQSELIQLDRNKLYLKALNSWFFFSKYKIHLVCRDPYDRIESFYKSKFIKAEENRLWMLEHEKNKNPWQHCTEIFFPYLDINCNMDPSLISKRLSLVKFEEFISILPKVFMLDRHLTPQYLATEYSLKRLNTRISIPFRLKKIFKIESNHDLNDLTRIFNIDLKVKKNNTTQIKKDIISWSPEAIKTVESIYSGDFKKFKYKKR